MSNKKTFLMDHNISFYAGVLATPRQVRDMMRNANSDKPAVTAGIFHMVEKELPDGVIAMAVPTVKDELPVVIIEGGKNE